MPIQTSFNAGEFSDLLDGAIDLDKRSFSLKTMQNIIGLKQGPAVRRGPTVFCNEVKDSSKRTFMIPFEFSDSQSYQIEVGDSYFRFYKNYQYLGVEIATPYTQDDLFDDNNIFQIQYAQSADVLYLVHRNYKPRVLSRTSDTSWTLSTIILEDGPYLDENTTSTTLDPSGSSGTVTVTASSVIGINNDTGFKVTDIGRLIQYNDGTDWHYLEITGWTSTTVVTAVFKTYDATHSHAATTKWRLGVWSDTTGWPRAISFFQDRLAMAGSTDYPDRYDLTATGGYSSTTLVFKPYNATGTVADDNAITGSVPSGLVNSIAWLASDLRGLVAGTSKEEFLIRATSLGDAITPSNKTAALFSRTGSAPIQPVRTTAGSTFIQTARRRLFDIVYSFEEDSLKPQDVTLAAEHITRNQVIAVSYQQEPINVLWAIRNDGVLIGMTHYPEQKVYGWHRHIIGGSGEVESISTIPAPDGSRDDLWLIVKRTINGQTKRYIEYMKPYYEDDIDIQDYACVDSQLSYSGTPVSTVSGLDHLEGETVRVMIDGRSHPDLVVSGGSITLANDRTASKIIVGLSYQWKIVQQRYEVKTQSGDTSQGKTKRISNFVARFLNTLGVKYGEPNQTMYEYDFEQGQSFDTNTPLFTGDTHSIVWPGGSNSDGQMQFEGDSVFPVCIIAIIPKIKVQA